jgi:hypothetical protein
MSGQSPVHIVFQGMRFRYSLFGTTDKFETILWSDSIKTIRSVLDVDPHPKETLSASHPGILETLPSIRRRRLEGLPRRVSMDESGLAFCDRTSTFNIGMVGPEAVPP